VVVEDQEGKVLAELSGGLGVCTNNAAEYRALIKGLEEASRLGAEEVDIFTDSELLARQLAGTYAVRSPGLHPLYRQAKEMLGRFSRWQVIHVPRERNRRADLLAGMAARQAEEDGR
jgi:ribonuclease HI